MSNKHLKKLHGAKDELSDLVSTLRDVAGEEDDSEDSDRNNDAFANKKPSVNLFQLVYQLQVIFTITELINLLFPYFLKPIVE